MALNNFISFLVTTGLKPLSANTIKNDIKTHGIGETTKKKQVFNSNDKGAFISRCKEQEGQADITPTRFKTCSCRKSAFSPTSSEEFDTCEFFTTKTNSLISQSILTHLLKKFHSLT